MARSGIQVHTTPPSLTEILPEVSAVLSHGGGGITHAALFAGRPQIAIPRHTEAGLTLKQLRHFGSGTEIDSNAEPDSIRDALTSVLSDDQSSRKAIEISRELKKRMVSSRERLVEACDTTQAAES